MAHSCAICIRASQSAMQERFTSLNSTISFFSSPPRLSFHAFSVPCSFRLAGIAHLTGAIARPPSHTLFAPNYFFKSRHNCKTSVHENCHAWTLQCTSLRQHTSEGSVTTDKIEGEGSDCIYRAVARVKQDARSRAHATLLPFLSQSTVWKQCQAFQQRMKEFTKTK